MKFNSISAERDYVLSTWKENKTLIQLFAIAGILHTGYLYAITFTSGARLTLYSSIILFGIHTTVPIAITILSFLNPLAHQFRSIIWYLLLSFYSVMMSVTIATRTVLCITGIERPEACVASARPVASAGLSVIYILLGPFLILTIMRNKISYEAPFVVLSVTMVIVVFLKTGQRTIASYLGIVFVIGAQMMGFLVARNREVVERNRFLSELRNIRLSNDLRLEVSKKTDAQKRAAEEEARRTQFTSVLFHEMRVPLNSVILSMNDLESDDSLKNNLHPETVETLEAINSGLNSIINIINDSLDFRKMNEGKLSITEKPFSLRKMVDALLRTMEPNWKTKDIIFFCDFDPFLYDMNKKILGDENRLRQVFANYLSNAAKFTPPAGNITLRIKAQDVTTDTFTLNVEVQDSGVGIKEQDQGKLFKPFVQIEPDKYQGGKGSGLGLSICATIISNMNGQYGLRSTFGKGSTFYFSVPLKISDVNVANGNGNVANGNDSVLDPHAPPELEKSLDILVTDDDKGTRRILRRILEKLKHRVDEAENGLECVQKAQQKDYDVIFIDNQMPIMDGLEAIRRIRITHQKVKIISLTGSSDEGQLEELRIAGASTILVKPAKLAQIKEILNSYGAQAVE